MSGKSRAFALAAVTAGAVALWAPAAMASSGPNNSGDAGVVNLSHNQTPIQACNDTVPVNVLGVQVPVNHVTGAGNLLSPASSTVAGQDNSCHQASGQANNSTAGHHAMGTSSASGSAGATGDTASAADSRTNGSSGGDAGVINLSHNQTPIQACNDQVPVNVLGVQVPVYDVVAALGVLAPLSDTAAGQDNSCHQGSAQANG
jgi:hypothetical protein